MTISQERLDWALGSPFDAPFMPPRLLRRLTVSPRPYDEVPWAGQSLLGDCWLVSGWNVRGWAKMREGGHNSACYRAHRWVFEKFHDVLLLPSEQLDHLCRRRGCCQPLHLECVNNLENARRRTEAIVTWREDNMAHELIYGY